MTPETFPIFLAGADTQSAEPLDVKSPSDSAVVGRTWLADARQYESAARACADAAPAIAAVPVHERAAVLRARPEPSAADARPTSSRVPGPDHPWRRYSAVRPR